MSKKKSSPQDAGGFVDAIAKLGDIEPIDRGNLTDAPLPTKRTEQPPTQSAVSRAGSADSGSATGLSIVRASRRELRQLRAGKIRPEEKIDLHGFTRENAYRRLCNTVARANLDGIHCLLVVHGRGHGSEEGHAVLRGAMAGWLETPPLVEQVIGSATAQPRDGGSGASYLLLRATGEKNPRSKRPRPF